MSISLECAKEHANDPAVLCCRAEEGVVLSSHNLEDPAIFDDLVDSGLLNLDGCLTIKEVIGATLTKTSDSLTPLTKDLINEVQNAFAEDEIEPEPEVSSDTEVPTAPAPLTVNTKLPRGTLKISIGEGKDIHIELPLSGVGQQPLVSSEGNAAGQSAASSLIAAGNAASGKAAAPEPKHGWPRQTHS